MRPDPGVDAQTIAIRGMDETARGRAQQRLKGRGLLLAWQQADAAGPMSELERAAFLLLRLHPDMPEVHRRQVLEALAAADAAGTWGGFRRPAPLDDAP